MRVSVAYASTSEQFEAVLELPVGASVADALVAVAQQPPFVEIDLKVATVGVFNEVVTSRERLLEAGDRVEIYRELLLDPLAARVRRAAAQRESAGEDGR
jgi:putative ubiquitin-RnfH superfamily antitoxin RatB of RatAB toxin-antitoxin module